MTTSNDWEPTYRDPREAFEQAIQEGRLALEPNAVNHAGRYMYMYTDPDTGRDMFKAIDTRKYDV